MAKSVLVIDTPPNCWECPLNYDYLNCITEDFGFSGFDQESGRHPKCPLVELLYVGTHTIELSKGKRKNV